MKKLIFTMVAIAATVTMSAQIVKVTAHTPKPTVPQVRVIKPAATPTRTVVITKPTPRVVVTTPRPAVVVREHHDDASDRGRARRWNHGKHKGQYKKQYHKEQVYEDHDDKDHDYKKHDDKEHDNKD